jgi:tetratricopeptide (TPR) repeat protein/Holliday junction resolvasome RuvABC ATP-dependent DNA helicase subunit
LSRRIQQLNATAGVDDGAVGQVPFVGRFAEFRNLTSSLDETCDRRQAHVVRVAGAPGIGKTRLAERFARLAALRGFRVLSIQAREATSRLPNGNLSDLLRDGLHVDEIGTLGHIERYVLGLGDHEPRDIKARSTSLCPPIVLYDSVARLLLRIAEARPLLIVFDDVNWIDRASAIFLRYFVRRARGHPVMVLLIAREPTSLRWVRELDEVVRPELLTLDVFDTEHAVRLVNACLERWNLSCPDRVKLEIARKSGGHPLFIVELLRRETSRPTLDGCRTVLAPDKATVPAAVVEHVADRVRSLRSRERRVLNLLAVAGRPLRLDQIAVLLGQRRTTIEATRVVSVLRRHSLIAVVDSRVSIAHDYLATSLVSSLTPTERLECHLTLANWYAQFSPESAGTVAMHFLQARETHSAWNWSLRAAQTSLDASSFADAMHYCDVATDSARNEHELLLVADVRFRTLVAGQMWQKALPLCNLLEARYREASDAVALGLVAAVRLENRMSGRASDGTSDWKELATSVASGQPVIASVPLLRTVLAAAHQQGRRSCILELLPVVEDAALRADDVRERAELYSLSTRMHCAHGREAAARRSAELCGTAAAGSGDPVVTLAALGAAGIAELTFGRVGAAVGHYREALDTIAARDLLGFAERLVGDYGWALAEAGALDESKRVLESAAARIESHRVLYVLANLCIALYEAQQWIRLGDVALRLLDINSVVEAAWASSAAWAFRGLAAYHLGDLARAGECLERVGSFGSDSSELGDYSFALVLRSRVQSSAGVAQAATRKLEDALVQLEHRNRFGRWRVALELARSLAQCNPDRAWRLAHEVAVHAADADAHLLANQAQTIVRALVQ